MISEYISIRTKSEYTGSRDSFDGTVFKNTAVFYGCIVLVLVVLKMLVLYTQPAQFVRIRDGHNKLLDPKE